MVSSDENDSLAGKNSPRNRKGSYESDIRGSIGSASSLASPDRSDDNKSYQLSRTGSIATSSVFEAHENGLTGSLDSLDVDGEVWDSISIQEQAVRLLSSHRKQSVTLQQIQVEMNQEKPAPSPEPPAKEEERHVDPIDDETAAHVNKVVASILKQYSKDSSDSDNSTAENSDTEIPMSPDEESEEEEDEQVFDFDAHIKKICRRDNGSDSESDGNESNTSEKVFKTAVRKAMKKIKQQRSDELADSDTGSPKASEKDTENERPPNSDDSSSESNDESSDDSSSSEVGSFEMTRDVDSEIQELMEGGLIIDPKRGQSGANEYRTVYKYYMTNEGRISSVQEPIDNHSKEAENPPKESARENNLASTLDGSKTQDLRWPFSSFYVKEVSQEGTFPDSYEALPSYRSTPASAAHPGRKRNVMLGRIWWVEWWAREDTKMKSSADTLSDSL